MVILLFYAFLLIVWYWCWLFAYLKKSLKVPGRFLLRWLSARWQFCICVILWKGSIFHSLNRVSGKANWSLNVIILIAVLCNLMTSFIIWFFACPHIWEPCERCEAKSACLCLVLLTMSDVHLILGLGCIFGLCFGYYLLASYSNAHIFC